MNKLLHTNFIRMRKSIAFCLSIAFILGWNAVLLFSNYEVMTKYEENIPLDSMLFSFLIIIGVVLSIVISFLIGTDYSDGTIRNKIVIVQFYHQRPRCCNSLPLGKSHRPGYRHSDVWIAGNVIGKSYNAFCKQFSAVHCLCFYL